MSLRHFDFDFIYFPAFKSNTIATAAAGGGAGEGQEEGGDGAGAAQNAILSIANQFIYKQDHCKLWHEVNGSAGRGRQGKGPSQVSFGAGAGEGVNWPLEI